MQQGSYGFAGIASRVSFSAIDMSAMPADAVNTFPIVMILTEIFSGAIIHCV